MKVREESARIQYIDILRVLSMLSVVFLHVAAGSLRADVGSGSWHLSNFLSAAMSASVPIFFMISGAMLLQSDRATSVKYLYQKRFTKIFIPFFVWSLVAIGYFAVMNYSMTGKFDITIITTKIKHLLSEPATVHLWFMYALIPIYMISPFLKTLFDNLSENLLKYMFGLWLVLTSIIPTIAFLAPARFKPFFELSGSYNLNIVAGYLGYFMLGYYLHTHDFKISKKILSLVVLADTLIITLGTIYATRLNGGYSEMFKGYTRLFVVVLSISVFLLIKKIASERKLSRRTFGIVEFLSAVSFGVYLFHNLLVNFVTKKVISLDPAGSFAVLICCYLAILSVSIFAIVILSSFKPTSLIFTGIPYRAACSKCNIQFICGKILRKSKGKQDDSTSEIEELIKSGRKEKVS